MNGLEYAEAMIEYEQQAAIVIAPTTRPNYPVMAKSVNLEKNVFHGTILNMYQIIGEILSEYPNVEIDLAEFGKFQAMNNQVMYSPVNKLKPSGLQGK